MSPKDVAIHAASEIPNIESNIARRGGKSAASENRRLAIEYIPSGKTILQSIGVYVKGARHMPCFQIPKSSNSGIHQVAHAHKTSVTPSMNGRIECRDGIVKSSGPIAKKKIR